MFEVEGKFWTDWVSIEINAGELKSLENQSALNDYYFRTFDGAEAFTSRIGEVGLESSPFESTLEHCEEWGQFDYDGEVSISNDADGFSFAQVDFGMISAQPEDEDLEVSVRYYSGFRISVAAESQEEAIKILNESGPKLFFVEDSSGNEWEIKEIAIDHIAELD